MEQTQTPLKITKDMVIGEILSLHPEKSPLLAEIMMDFGIHCVGCGAASFETLEQGVLGHGFSEDQLDNLVNSLNNAIRLEEQSQKTMTEFKLQLTPKAIEQVKQAMNSSENKTSTLRVSIIQGGCCSGPMYDLEIASSPKPGDINFKQDNINIAVSRSSLETLNGTEIDFISSEGQEGFKFNNPNEIPEAESCGCAH